MVQYISDTYQTLCTGFQFDERAVVGDDGDDTPMDRAQRVVGSYQIPRIVLLLLHATANAAGFSVELNDLNLDSFAFRQDLGRVAHTALCHVGDMQQVINATQVNECTIFGDVFDAPSTV